MFRFGTTATLLVLVVVCFFTTAPAQSPPTGYIGLYIDEARTACSLGTVSYGQSFSFYIFCLPSENGMICAEFSISIPSSVVISDIVENEGVSVALGDPAGGLSVCFGECQTDWVYTHRVDAVAYSTGPAELLVAGHGQTGEVLFASCDDGFPVEPVFVNPGIGINGPCVDDTDPPGLAELSSPDTMHLLLTFDEEIFADDALTVSYIAVNINDPDDRMDVSHVLLEQRDPTRVLLTLERALAGNDSYALYVGRVRDRAGNRLPSGSHIDIDLDFDITPPEITGIEVISDWELIVHFSEPLIPETAEDRFTFLLYVRDGEPERIEKAEYLATSNSIRVSLKNQLRQKTRYGLQMWGMTDLVGNVLVHYPVISFYAIDKAPPLLLSVVAFDPDNVTVLFDEAVDVQSSTDPDNYRIFVTGTSRRFVDISSVETLYPDRIRLNLAHMLDEDTDYSIFVSGVSDRKENTIPEEGLTDIVKRPVPGAPYIVSVEYMKTSIPPHIRIVFSETVVNGDRIEAYRLICSDQPNGIILFRDARWLDDGVTALGQLIEPLKDGGTYDIGLDKLVDLEGTAAPSGYKIRFNAADFIAPPHSITYSEGGVDLSWELSRLVGSPEIIVSRADGVDGFFYALPPEGLSSEGLEFSYRDLSVEPGGSYVYRVDYSLETGIHNCLVTDSFEVPDLELDLLQNVPNPFNPSTVLSWFQPEEGAVLIEIFDVKGRRIAVLERSSWPKGNNSIEWNGRNDSGNPLSSGVYFYRLSFGGTVKTKKMVLLR